MLTKEQLWQLRQEIPLGSIFIQNYVNSFDLSPSDVCDFFDSYLEYLEKLMEYDIPEFTDVDFWEYLDDYDTIENLWECYSGFDYDPLRQLWKLEIFDDGTYDVIDTILIDSLDEPSIDVIEQIIEERGYVPYDSKFKTPNFDLNFYSDTDKFDRVADYTF